MAVVVYQCNVCKRTKEFQRNEQSVETFGHCTITQGCRGQLHQIQLLPDFIRPSRPSIVGGLEDWSQKTLLHDHKQRIPQQEWVINHKMGVYPLVTIRVDRPTQDNPSQTIEVSPTDTIIIDENTIKLVFDTPYSGVAQLFTQQSDPNLLTPIQEIEQEVNIEQISNEGELTIATLVRSTGEAPVVELQLFFSSDNTTIPVTYVADSEPSLLSAWIDYERVIIKGKTYIVRSFSGITQEMITGVITNGSYISVKTINNTDNREFRDIESEEVLFLLARDPYATADKRTNVFIDAYNTNLEEYQFDMFYQEGNFFVNQHLLTNVFPHIRSQ